MEIILKTELEGIVRGVPCELQPYVCRLTQRPGDQIVFQVGQPFADGTTGWTSGWYLKDLLDLTTDGLYIDFGQDWKVRGIKAAIKEALEYVEFKFKKRSKP